MYYRIILFILVGFEVLGFHLTLYFLAECHFFFGVGFAVAELGVAEDPVGAVIKHIFNMTAYLPQVFHRLLVLAKLVSEEEDE